MLFLIGLRRRSGDAMKRLLLCSLMIMLLVGMLFPGMLPATRAQSVPLTSLAAVVFPGTKSAPAFFGVYVGQGLIVTNWHPWTLDGRYQAAAESPLSPSRQVALYDDDGIDDPGEYLLAMAVCDGVWQPIAAEIAADPGCTPFGRFAEAGFIFPGVGETVEDELLPVGRLLYANRAFDIAVFEVDQAGVEARGVTPVRLSMVRPVSGAPVVVPDQAAQLVATMVSADTTALLPELTGRGWGTPWQVMSLTIAAPQGLPDGAPVLDKLSGNLMGLVWRADENGERWITPVMQWIHALFAANESLQHAGLAAVLADTALDVVDGELTLHDPLMPGLGNGGIDVQHVTLDLAFDLDTHMLAGTATLDIRATVHQLGVFALDAAGLTIDRVLVDGVEAGFVAKSEKLQIQAGVNPLPYGQVFQVVIDYHASPQPFRSAYMPGFDIGLFWGEQTVSTLDQPDGAHTWFPINDHPSDRATYEFRLRVAEPLTAVANGQLIETLAHDDGTRTFVWRMDQSMASYLTVVAIADYAAIADQAADGTPITHYVYRDQALLGKDLFSYTDEALIDLEQWFGPYPYATYGHVVAPVQGMALETQTMTTMPDSIMGWTELEVFELMVHELAHQWFGDTVTPGVWSDIWLNEGFARFAQWLMLAERFGADAALAGRTSAETRLISDGRRTPLFDPLPEETFGVATYDKGGWVLHMLRVELGDAVFFDLLRTYTATFADRPATTLDFWQLAERLSGRDLGAFFTQWVLQADGIPNLRLYWTETDSGVDMRLCPAESEYYQLRVPVRMMGETNWRDEVLTLDDVSGVTASFTLDFVPREVIADPAQNLLAQIQVQPIAVLPEGCEGGS